MTFKPQLHPDFSYKAYRVGNEKTPVLVIDNFMDRAELLVDYCAGVGRLEKIDSFYRVFEYRRQTYMCTPCTIIWVPYWNTHLTCRCRKFRVARLYFRL